jgi:threonine aldolase
VLRRIDLRSDTVTQPTPAMREAMAHATVGDDGYGEDPTVNELEATFARMVGKDEAMLLPSGIMANQVAVRVLANPGELMLVGAHQHICSFEMGASARNSGVQFATLDDSGGVLDLGAVREVIDAEVDHQPHVGAACVEQTHMYSGGVPWTFEQLRSLRDALEGRPLHLDGARLFNAAVATNATVAEIAAPATTVMASLSKGLCAPVGSLLAGPADLMARARIERKRLGGAMRQAGVLAAAGLVGLTTMVDRLADDHVRARQLAVAFARRFPESGYDALSCVTNIVSFNHPDARAIVEQLGQVGVLGGTVGPKRARFVTHAGIDDDQVAEATALILRFRLH